MFSAGVVDEDAAHRLGGETVELAPIRVVGVFLAHQPDVGLVHQAGCSRRRVAAPAVAVGPRQVLQLAIHERHKLLEHGPLPRQVLGHKALAATHSADDADHVHRLMQLRQAAPHYSQGSHWAQLAPVFTSTTNGTDIS